jgi:hypothetical protein
MDTLREECRIAASKAVAEVTPDMTLPLGLGFRGMEDTAPHRWLKA